MLREALELGASAETKKLGACVGTLKLGACRDIKKPRQVGIFHIET